MTQKHTPGPWYMLPPEDDKPYLRVRGGQLGCRHKIANVLHPASNGVDDHEWHETEANARLIAAAPDFYKAAMLRRECAALPQDRGGARGPKALAMIAWLDAENTAVAKADGTPEHEPKQVTLTLTLADFSLVNCTHGWELRRGDVPLLHCNHGGNRDIVPIRFNEECSVFLYKLGLLGKDNFATNYVKRVNEP